MPHCPRTKQDVEGRVTDMFRLAERDYDLTIKRLVLLTGESAETLNSYKNGTAIPLHVFVHLCRFIPDELTSICMEPAAKHVGANEPDDGSIDELGREAAVFVAEKLNAEADGVVTHIERSRLKDRARRVCAKARAVAA